MEKFISSSDEEMVWYVQDIGIQPVVFKLCRKNQARKEESRKKKKNVKEGEQKEKKMNV